MNQDLIDQVEMKLMSAKGKRYVTLATTANQNNPPFYVGGLRQGNGVTSANFIFAAPDLLPDVISRFDGRIDAFLVDTEIKNSLDDMEERAEKLIRETPIVRIKPNDMTVLALDLWLVNLFPDMRGSSALIVGTGNIGAKIALVLAERGVIVRLYDRDREKLERIMRGLNEIKRGHGHLILAAEDDPAIGTNIIVGCTPGIPAVTKGMIDSAAENSLVIDVGNGTLFPEAIKAAHQRGARIFCLSPEAGFIGWIAALVHTRKQIDNMKRRVLSNSVVMIGPGVLGGYGDVIVDNPDDWQRVLGVCDGRGDVLPPEEGANFIAKLKNTMK